MQVPALFRTTAIGMLLLACAAGAEAPDEGPAAAVRVVADDGAWGYAGPHAVAGNGMLFLSYLDQAGTTWVAAIDAENGGITRTKVWEGDADLHSANPVCVRPDGRIQVFVDPGSYVDNLMHWRTSETPWDISAFGPAQQTEFEADIIQGRQFYPMAARPSGNIYVIINALRDDAVRETVMWWSRDGGDTFANYARLWSLAEDLRGNRSYTRAYVEGSDIHIVAVRVGWTEQLDGHSIGRSEGVYYIRFDTTDEAFYRADGTRAFSLEEAPVYGPDHFDEVWHWERHGNSRQRGLWADVVAKDGRPYVAFAVQEAVPEGESALHDGYWAAPDDNGQWRHHKVATLARGWDNRPERKNYAIAIDPDAPHTVFVAKSTDADADLSQVQRMTTTDNGETWETLEILSGKGRITTVVVPRRADATPRPLDVLWLDGPIEGWRHYHTRIMTHQTSGE